MNVDLHRLVFNKARGMCVAVAETAASSSKSGAAARGERHAVAAAVPAVFIAALSLLASAALQAQTRAGLPTGGAITQGAGSVSVEGAKMIVNQTTPRMVADWNSFSIGAGNTVQFVQPSSSSVALNRVLGSDASQIFGSLLSNGHVYLQNPNGVLFAPGAQVSVGSLVATSLNADLRAFMDGSLRLSGGSTASGLVRNEGNITTSAGGLVLLAGPQVSNSGTISTPGGTLALAAGNAVQVDPTGSGLMSISVPVAAVNAQLENTGRLLADGGLVALQASLHSAATDAARRSVMNVGGVVRARSIEQRNGQIILSGGSSGTVSVSGTLDASGGEGLAGGSVKVLGERVALVDQARLDASGGTGGGTVLVGGNYQGHGPEANAAYTSVGKDVVIDASARDRGNGGLAVVWSDKTTTYAGQANARGGEQRGDGGLVEVSGKEQLNFSGGADLRAGQGKSGRLLLDPTSITIGAVANVNGDPTPGDDVTGNIPATAFPGAASQITAAQVATLLGTADLSLAATNNITVSSPITMVAGGPATTLSLTAGFNVTLNAATTLGNTSLVATTTATSGDTIQVNAPIQTAGSVALTSNRIELSSSLTAANTTLRGATGAFFNQLVELGTGAGITTNLLTLGNFSNVTLTSRTNQVNTLDVSAGTATIDIDNPVGTPLDLRGGVTSLNLTSNSGITQSTGAGQALFTGDGEGGGFFQLTTLDAGATTGQVNLTNPNNNFTGNFRFNVASSINTVTAGSLRVTNYVVGAAGANSSAGGNIVLRAPSGVFYLATNLQSNATSGGTNIDITGRGFVGEFVDFPSGPYGLLVPSGGRFLVRSTDYTQDDIRGFNFAATGTSNFNFKVYNGYTGTIPSTGNGFFTNQLGYLTPGLPAVNRAYNGNTAFNFTVTGAGASVLEDFSGDLVFRSTTGAYTVNGTGNFADKNVGINKAYTTNASTDVTAVASVAGVDAGATYFGLTAQSVSRPAGASTPTFPLPTSQVTALGVAVTGVTANNKVYDATTAATLSGTPTAGTVAGDVVAVGGTPVATFNNKNVGTAKPVTVTGYTLTGTDAANYTLTPPIGLTANVTPLARAITGVTAVSRGYNATTVATLTGTPSVTPLLTDVLTVTGTGVGAFNDRNVGTAKPVSVTGYTFGGTDGGNYTAVQPTGLTANITPLGLTVTGLTASNKVYDTTTAATLTGTATAAALPGDVVTVVGTGVGTFNNKNVGTAKPVSVIGFSFGGLDGGNYTVQQPTGLAANITPANLQVSGIGAANKVYDTTTAATLTGTAGITALGADVVTLGGSGVGTFNNKNVGTAKPVAIAGYSVSGLDAGNYTLLQPAGVTANITPATLTLAGVTAANKVYDTTVAATLVGSGTVTPLPGDSVTLGSGTGTFNNKNVGSAKPVTVTGYTLGGTDGGNYSLVLPATLVADITPAALTVTGLTVANKVYDATTTATLSGTPFVGALSGDSVSVGGVGSATFANKNAGAGKAVTLTGFSLAGLDAGNYTLQPSVGLTADISVATLAITGIGAADKVYDATTAATLTGSAVVAPLGSDNVGVGGSGQGVFVDRNVGTNKPVIVSGFTLVGPDAANYVARQPSGVTASITAASLPVDGLQITGISAANKVYDGSTRATLTGTPVVRPIGEDQVSVGGSGVGNFANKNVGTGKPVTVTGFTLTGLDAGNYSVLQPSGLTADITPAPLALTGLVALDKVYDATTVARLTGLATISAVSGDLVALNGSALGAFANKNVGTAKAVTVGGYSLSGADAGNYTLLVPTNLTASITPASLALAGIAASNKTYDGNTAATLTGIATAAALAGDVVTVGGAGVGSFNNKNVGTAKPVTVSGFTLGGTDAGNYTLTQPSGLAANISAASLVVGGVTAANKVYDSTVLASLVGTPAVTAVAGDVVSVAGNGVGSFDNKNVGTAKPVTVGGFTLSGADAGNYTVVQPAGLRADVTPATIVVGGVAAAPKVYDTTTGVSLTGTPVVTPLGNDTLVLQGTGNGVLPDKNAGTARPVQVSGFTLGGADAANYTLRQPTGVTVDVAPRTVTPTGITAIDRPADGTTTVALNTTAASVNGVLAGDAVGLVTSGAVGTVATPAAGSGKLVLVRGLALSGPDAVNYALLPTTDPSGASGVAIGTVTLLSGGQQLFESVRDREYLQGVSDAQEPFRRALAEALAAGFGKENIRKQLQRGLVFETGLAPPAVDTIAPATAPASCTMGSNGAGLRLACN